jgi:hypothetical protein
LRISDPHALSADPPSALRGTASHVTSPWERRGVGIQIGDLKSAKSTQQACGSISTAVTAVIARAPLRKQGYWSDGHCIWNGSDRVAHCMLNGSARVALLGPLPADDLFCAWAFTDTKSDAAASATIARILILQGCPVIDLTKLTSGCRLDSTPEVSGIRSLECPTERIQDENVGARWLSSDGLERLIKTVV